MVAITISTSNLRNGPRSPKTTTNIALPFLPITHLESRIIRPKELPLGSSLTFVEVPWNTL
jgi:hypothetical protein